MSAGRATTEHGMGGVGIMRDARAVGAVRELASVRLTTRAREASGPGRGVRPGEG